MRAMSRAAHFSLPSLAAAAAIALVANGASAQPAPPSPPAPPQAKVTEPAIARIAATIAEALKRAEPRALVIAGALVTDAPAQKGDKLTALIASQIAGRRGQGSAAKPEPLALAAARAAAKGFPALVYVSVEIAGGKLRVTADVYPVRRSVWAKARVPDPGPVAHAYADASIDAEVRSYLAPLPLTSANVERGKHFESDVVAVACGDLDQDGSPEIVAVSRRRVTTLRIKGGRVIPLVSRAWPDLAPVAPAPLREPIAFATIIEGLAPSPAFLDVGLTDRAKSVRLDGELHVVASFGGLAVPEGARSACTRLSGITVTGPIGPCLPGDPAPLAHAIGGVYDAFASARLVSSQGKPFSVWVGREKGVVELRDESGRKVLIEGAGAQIAVGDIDQDGDPDVMTSLDTMNPFDDAVLVRSWSRASQSNGSLRDVLRIPAAAGVRAIGVCPPDGPGRAPFVVATTDEIWVVR